MPSSDGDIPLGACLPGACVLRHEIGGQADPGLNLGSDMYEGWVNWDQLFKCSEPISSSVIWALQKLTGFCKH